MRHLTPVPQERPEYWKAGLLPTPRNVVGMAEGLHQLCCRLAEDISPAEAHAIMAELTMAILCVEKVEQMIRARVGTQAKRLGLMP